MVNSFSFLFLYQLFVICGLLRRFTPRNDSTLVSSLRGFEKAVAISFILGLSLRELFATRGNLSMATTAHNPSLSLRRPKACGNP